MSRRPSIPKPGAAPCLIKAKPLRAALSRAGLDKPSARRPWKGARPGRGKAIFNRTGKYHGGCLHAHLTPFPPEVCEGVNQRNGGPVLPAQSSTGDPISP